MTRKPTAASFQNGLTTPADLFQAWAETAPEIFFVVDPSLRLSYVNPFAARLLKKKPQALIGKHLKEIFPPGDFKIQRRNLRRVFSTGSSLYHEDWIHFSGKALWLGVRLVPLRDPREKVNAVLGVARDYTAQKSLETALQDGERKYRNLAEQIPGVVYLASGQAPGKLIYVSPRIQDLLGFTPEEWLADWRLWIKQLHPQDRQRVVEAAARAVRTGTPFLQEYRLFHRRGDLVWLYDQAHPVKDEAGRLLYFHGVNIDITRRKKAEADLIRAEERYRQVLENSDEAILVIQDGWVKFCNPKSVAISGYSVEEQMGRPFVEFMDPGNRDRVMKNYSRRMAGKPSPARYELTFIHKDGRPRFFRINTKVITWENLPASLVFATDITEKKLVQEALQDSEGRYRTLFEATEEGVFIISEAGRVIDLNQAGRKLFGFKKTDPLDDYFAADFYVRQEDRRAFVEAMHRKGYVHNFETAYRRFDGTTFQALVNATLQRDEEGRPLFMGIIRDMTERRKAEEALQESERKYRGLIETTDTGFVILDDRGKVVDANPQYVRLTGHRRLKEIIHRGVEEWTLAIGRAKNLEAVQACLKNGSVRGLEITYAQPRGRTLTVEINATVVPGPEGNRILSLVRDVTARKQNELALRKSRKELRNLSEHLQALLEKERIGISRRIHDELGQQLTALKMDLFWLSRHFPEMPPPIRQKADSMSQALDETIHTVQNICEELRPALLDNLGLIDALEWQIKQFIERTGLNFALTISPRNLLLAQEDATLIFRLFQEILNNVFLHARASRVIITLKKKANLVELNIRDNGLGITEAQINSPRSFGLLGMRERVDARGGKIIIRGLAGKGTEVAIKIPLSKKEQRHD